MSHVTIPVKWLNELLDLCGPEDHELRERVMKSAAPAAPAVDAVDADGARYRYLRDEHIGDDPESINLPPGKKRGLDSAVDAAIAAQAAAKVERGHG